MAQWVQLWRVGLSWVSRTRNLYNLHKLSKLQELVKFSPDWPGIFWNPDMGKTPDVLNKYKLVTNYSTSSSLLYSSSSFSSSASSSTFSSSPPLRTVQHNAVKISAEQGITLYCSAVCSAVQYGTVQYSTIKCTAV